MPLHPFHLSSTFIPLLLCHHGSSFALFHFPSPTAPLPYHFVFIIFHHFLFKTLPFLLSNTFPSPPHHSSTFIPLLLPVQLPLFNFLPPSHLLPLPFFHTPPLLLPHPLFHTIPPSPLLPLTLFNTIPSSPLLSLTLFHTIYPSFLLPLTVFYTIPPFLLLPFLSFTPFILRLSYRSSSFTFSRSPLLPFSLFRILPPSPLLLFTLIHTIPPSPLLPLPLLHTISPSPLLPLTLFHSITPSSLLPLPLFDTIPAFPLLYTLFSFSDTTPNRLAQISFVTLRE